MFCPHCGKQIQDNEKYCAFCGNKVNELGIVKPIVTNVGYDDTLPKNSNFAMVIILLIFIAIGCLIYLRGYKEKYDYTEYVLFDNHKFYLPIGYTYKIEDDESNTDYLYIYNDSLSYLFKFYIDNYNDYIVNDNRELRKQLGKQDINIKNINNSKYKDRRITLVEFENEEGTYYWYLYEYDDYDNVVSGFIYKNSDIKDNDLNTLYEILDRIQ